jgi:hypothetical protein
MSQGQCDAPLEMIALNKQNGRHAGLSIFRNKNKAALEGRHNPA